MSAAIVVDDDGIILLGCDSRITSGWASYDGVEKMTVVQGVSSADWGSDGTLSRHRLVTPTWAFVVLGLAALNTWLRLDCPRQTVDQTDEQYLAHVVASAIDHAARMRWTANADTGPMCGSILAACERGAWAIDAHGAIERVNGVQGGGDPTAVVAAYRMARSCGVPVQEAAQRALAIVSTVYVSANSDVRTLVLRGGT